MKSPAELSDRLKRQWQSADLRESRLAGEFPWPISLSIGKPSADSIKNASALVREHLKKWRSEKTGLVEWSAVKFQSTGSAVDIPRHWLIRNPDEWTRACSDPQVNREFEFLSQMLNRVDNQFHVLLVRQRSLWKEMTIDQLVQCCELALQLEPGCAQGRPIRALTIANIDSKFIESNRTLLVKLLNERFNQALQKTSLEEFLGAALNNDHWLLVIALSNGLLPFAQLRLRASELARIELPGSHVLFVENEQCRYQLPQLDDTIAILGAGLNLSWLNNPFFKTRQLAYWGDIDSWGLKMLAMARKLQPELAPLLMNRGTFEQYQHLAVSEPRTAGWEIPSGLTELEGRLYQHLLKDNKGRLEQEFIDKKDVYRELHNWHKVTGG